MKKILTTVVLAAFFMLFSMTANAEPNYYYYETPTVTETPVNAIIDNPQIPGGQGTVIDFSTDYDGRMFYTIQTADGNVFYLVIDKQRGTDNVYFLTAVTVADLVSLAGLPPSAIPTPLTTTAPPNGADSGTNGETPALESAPQQSDNMGFYIIIAVLAVAGVGAGWYIKIYKPKQQGAGNEEAEEYEPHVDEEIGIRDWNEEDFDATQEGIHPWYQETESEVEQDEIY